MADWCSCRRRSHCVVGVGCSGVGCGGLSCSSCNVLMHCRISSNVRSCSVVNGYGSVSMILSCSVVRELMNVCGISSHVGFVLVPAARYV